jgi:ABC-type transport system involved in Fe-S cluster assembly fused permease/ATPase subunit
MSALEQFICEHLMYLFVDTSTDSVIQDYSTIKSRVSDSTKKATHFVRQRHSLLHSFDFPSS